MVADFLKKRCYYISYQFSAACTKKMCDRLTEDYFK